MEPGHRVTRSAIFAGLSRVSVSDPVFDQVLCFNMRVYRGVVSTEKHNLGIRQTNICIISCHLLKKQENRDIMCNFMTQLQQTKVTVKW